MIGIYKITNKINGRVYIGQSVQIERRWREHIHRDEQYVDKAIEKYGVKNFIFEVIEECLPDQLEEREKHWIQEYNSMAPNGYNLNAGQGGAYGENSAASILTEEDIIFIRNCYKNKVYETSKDLWKKHYPERSQGTIEAVFFGKSWTHIMMQIYTSELRDYYYQNYLKRAIGGRGRLGEENPMALVKETDAIKMRIEYQHKERKILFKEFSQYSARTITAIITGENWKHLPIYKKREKMWIYPTNWNEEQTQAFQTILKEYEDK